MSVETNRLRSTLEILEAILAALKAIDLPQGQKAFQRVEHFDLTDYADAMQRLAMNQDRTALVIWTGDEYENERQTIILTSRRIMTIDVFVSDRRLDAPVKALIGDRENFLPGVLGLRDLVVPKLSGPLLDSEDGKELIYLVPQSTERGIVANEDKSKFPARQILILSFQVNGEFTQVGVESNESIA